MKDNKYNESILSMRNQNKIQYCCLKDNNSNNILYNEYSYNSSDQLEKINFDTLDIENIVIYNNMGLINENKLRTPGSTTYLLIYSYEYDMLGRVREEKQDNVVTNTYTYYNNGDIKTYNNKLYEYENGILISIDNNPLTYTNKYFLHTYLGKTYDWTNNRLTSYNDGNTTYYYEYDYKGLRRKKIYNNITTTYYYDDNNRLMFERKVNSNQVTEISYIYDMKELIGFKYNGNRYYYIKDLLGNICYIMNENKNILVTYKYSAYGIIEETGNLEIRNINHFKYKSYYYDNESNMYYLITRYYLPEIGRFISPDDINYLDINKHTGYNLYSYCNNNPVMYSDPDGHGVISLLIGLGISLVVGFGASTISQGVQYGWSNINYIQSGIDALFAVASTALAYTGIGIIGSVIAGGIMGASQYTLDSKVFHNDFSWGGLAISTGLGLLSGFVSGYGARNATALAKNNFNTEVRNGIKSLLTAAEKYGIDSVNYTRVLNLYGSVVSNAINNAISSNFTKSLIKICISTIFNSGLNVVMSKIK